jgi:hypothetical protein
LLLIHALINRIQTVGNRYRKRRLAWEIGEANSSTAHLLPETLAIAGDSRRPSGNTFKTSYI